MGDELNEKTSQLIEVVSGGFFLAVVRVHFFGKNSSNPFSRSYFFRELVSDGFIIFMETPKTCSLLSCLPSDS